MVVDTNDIIEDFQDTIGNSLKVHGHELCRKVLAAILWERFVCRFSLLAQHLVFAR